LLPLGGGMTGDINEIIRKLKAATDKTRRMGNMRVQFDAAARELWIKVYEKLSAGEAGLLGSLTNRAEAHTVRVALIYALLDGADDIRIDHLRAALEVWRYCDDSARYIWGNALGDPTADEILRVLKASMDGLTRWDISNHFGRHKPATELDRALNVLLERSLIRAAKEETAGRPTTRYLAA
jgi:hypothetical protein